MAKAESKSYDPAAVERPIFDLWERGGYFHPRPDDRPPDRRFSMVIPPPNVTGALHLGHALNNTLQDILVRRKRMQGFNTFWLVGTDHAGIATQATVEKAVKKDEGKDRHDLGRDELVRRIWQWKEKHGGRIIEQLKLMGCSCDYRRERFTLDDGCARAVRETFFRLFRDGLIYRGKRLVNWDTQLQTAVADDEVYHETVKGHFYHFKYPIVPVGQASPPAASGADARPTEARPADEPTHVHIATTRPETMLADTAVAVHPEPDSALDAAESALRAKLAEASEKERAGIQSQIDDIAGRRRTLLPTLLKLRDMARAGRKVLLPLADREIPLICDEWADPALGTGCVKITPAHDPNDYDVAQRHGLPMINVLTPDGKVARIVEPDGTVNPNSGNYEGLPFATKARKKVVEDLTALGLVERIEDRDIDLGHSDRSKAPIEPYLSDQWFVKMGNLTAAETTTEPPDAGELPDAIEPRTSVRAAPANHRTPALNEPRTSVRAAPANDRTPAPSEPRTSVRAVPPNDRTPDLSQGAVLVTWTTYGTWLPGDARGFVSRVPQSDGGHAIHNMPGEPYDADDPALRSEASERMEGDPVYLNTDQARVVLASVAGTAERHGIELLAVAVLPNHVHVLCQTERSGPELQKLFKGAASRLLGQRFELDKAPRWFTRRGSNRFIRKGSDLTPAIDYVLRQVRPLVVWGFNFDAGEAAEVVERARAAEEGEAPGESRAAARTEVRGSQVGSGGGERFVTLGNGSRAPGLAQAAIDALCDDDQHYADPSTRRDCAKVHIFPRRYQKTYLDWLGEKRDWCISRQLWWGHRIPVWELVYDTIEMKQFATESEFRARIAEYDELLSAFLNKVSIADQVLVVERPRYYWERRLCCRTDRAFAALQALLAYRPRIRQVSSWGESDAIPVRLPGFEDASHEAMSLNRFTIDLSPDEDVLDTWFSSALWPHSTLGWPDETDSDAPRSTTAARTEVRGSSPDPQTSDSEPRTSGRAAAMTPATRRMNQPPAQDHAPDRSGRSADPAGGTHTRPTCAEPQSAIRNPKSEIDNPQSPIPNPQSEPLLPYYYPTSVLSTAREIITLWVARMVMTGLYNVGKVPFRDVVIHPVIQDGEGRKMSKTLGNGVDPVDIIEEYGADALRFTLADLATETQDIRMPVQPKKLPEDIRMPVQPKKLPDGRTINVSPKFEKGRNFCNKLWQAATGFVLRNLDGYDPRPLDPKTLRLEDRWILSRLAACLADVETALDAYRFSEAVGAAYRFTWDEFCSWYIETAKPRLVWDGEGKATRDARSMAAQSSGHATRGQKPRSEDRGSAQQVLVYVLDRILRVLHPFIPFVTEAAWKELNDAAPRRGLETLFDGEPALVAAAWPVADEALRDAAAESEMATLQDVIRAIREIRTLVNDYRSRQKQPALRSLPRSIITADADRAAQITRYGDFVKLLANCDLLEIETAGAKPPGSMTRVFGPVHVHVPVSRLIDMQLVQRTEESKLDERRQAWQREQARLANPSFVERADPAVVERARSRAAELSNEIAMIERHLAELQ